MPNRLSDDELNRLAEIANTHTGGIQLGQVNARRVFEELADRRKADVELAQLNTELRIQQRRRGSYSYETVTRLLDALDKFGEANES